MKRMIVDGQRERSTPSSRLRWSVAAALLAVIALAVPPVAADAAVAPKPQTVVSLTFDDGNADQLNAVSVMNTYNMKGTFYIVSGYIGAATYLSRDNLTALKAAGHEIGGHTVNHPDLTTISAAEASRQICNDRAALTSWGFSVRSFAYPFASSNTAVQNAVKNCGYNSARMLGDIKSRFGCSGCAYAETIPPSRPYYTKALDQVDSTWTLADLKASVTNAETKGGWVQLTFHNICANVCSDISVSPTVFSQFAAWLAPRAATNNTVVKTVGDVIGGAVKPVVGGAVAVPAGPGVNGIVNPSLETAGTTGPSCWMPGGYGANTAAFSTVAPGRTGAVASKITMTGYSDGDAKLLPTFDLGACSPTVVAAHTYSMRAWYTSTTVTQFAVYLRNAAGAWQYWTSSPWFAAAPAFTQAVWTTPPIPAGMTGLSFGLNIFGNGTITTDDYSLYDSVGAPAPVATVIAPPSPAVAPKVQGPVEVHTPTESTVDTGTIK